MENILANTQQKSFIFNQLKSKKQTVFELSFMLNINQL